MRYLCTSLQRMAGMLLNLSMFLLGKFLLMLCRKSCQLQIFHQLSIQYRQLRQRWPILQGKLCTKSLMQQTLNLVGKKYMQWHQLQKTFLQCNLSS